MYQVLNAKEGNCSLCVGPKDGDRPKKVFVVQGPGYSGDICADHLFVMTRQNAPKAESAKPAPVNGPPAAVPVPK